MFQDIIHNSLDRPIPYSGRNYSPPLYYCLYRIKLPFLVIVRQYTNAVQPAWLLFQLSCVSEDFQSEGVLSLNLNAWRKYS